MITRQRHSVSVAGVAVDDHGRALIIQRRDNGHWEPPGGVLEHGETIEDGLRREVYEETGLKVEPEALTGVYQNMHRHIVALVFRCRVIDGALAVNAEASAFRWATSDEATELMAEAYATRVLDALTPEPRPVVRAHDGTHLL
jgi:ADP-ribose pyrophosphatase YjhB (NUDIX family)